MCVCVCVCECVCVCFVRKVAVISFLIHMFFFSASEEMDMSQILKRQDEEPGDTLNLVKGSVDSNNEYIGKIRKRLQEDASARQEREKRRRKVLGEQMAAHEVQEVSEVVLL